MLLQCEIVHVALANCMDGIAAESDEFSGVLVLRSTARSALKDSAQSELKIRGAKALFIGRGSLNLKLSRNDIC